MNHKKKSHLNKQMILLSVFILFFGIIGLVLNFYVPKTYQGNVTITTGSNSATFPTASGVFQNTALEQDTIKVVKKDSPEISQNLAKKMVSTTTISSPVNNTAIVSVKGTKRDQIVRVSNSVAKSFTRNVGKYVSGATPQIIKRANTRMVTASPSLSKILILSVSAGVFLFFVLEFVMISWKHRTVNRNRRGHSI